jgi:hypothetical protein
MTLKLHGNSGKNNGQWKGDAVGYAAIHEYIRHRFPKPDKCLMCNKPKKLELANKSNRYKRILSDWEWLCRRCHMESDGRLKKFKLLREKVQPLAAEKRRKRIICINDGRIFESAYVAAIKTGFHRGSIGQVCLGRWKSCRGYKFRFLDDD